MKLFHTADVHLDHGFAGCRVPPAIANWRRQHLRELFMELLRRAASVKADAILIAGDLFEAGRVTRDTVAFLREAFDLARPVPVFIAPGQADPYGPACPYAAETWPGNVHIFREPHWAAVPVQGLPLTIHGAACVEDGLAKPSLDRLRIQGHGEGIHVALAHACWAPRAAGEVSEDHEALPVPELPPGLAYLALGHAHAAAEVRREGAAAAWYSGAPETFNFDQPGTPGYLEVNIGSDWPASPIEVVKIETGYTRYLSQTLDCQQLEHESQVVSALSAIGRAQACDTIARIALAGMGPAAARWSVDRIAAEAAKEFVHLELTGETMPPSGSRHGSMEGDSRSLFIARMERDLADTADPKRKAMLRRASALGLMAYHGALPGAGTS